MEDRIIELEVRVLYQDDVIQSLNEIVTRQQLELAQIRLEMYQLKQQVQDMAPSLMSAVGKEPPPPHY